nr:hypothetical protein [Endozoicomonas sp.]
PSNSDATTTDDGIDLGLEAAGNRSPSPKTIEPTHIVDTVTTIKEQPHGSEIPEAEAIAGTTATSALQSTYMHNQQRVDKGPEHPEPSTAKQLLLSDNKSMISAGQDTADCHLQEPITSLVPDGLNEHQNNSQPINTQTGIGESPDTETTVLIEQPGETVEPGLSTKIIEPTPTVNTAFIRNGSEVPPPVEKALPASSHSIMSAGQQPVPDRQPQSSRTEEIAHGMFGHVKYQLGNSPLIAMHARESEVSGSSVLDITELSQKGLETFLSAFPESPVRFPVQREYEPLADEAIPSVHSFNLEMKPEKPMIPEAIDDRGNYSEVYDLDDGGAVEDKSGIPSLGASDEDLTTKMGQFSLSEKVSTNNVNRADDGTYLIPIFKKGRPLPPIPKSDYETIDGYETGNYETIDDLKPLASHSAASHDPAPHDPTPSTSAGENTLLLSDEENIDDDQTTIFRSAALNYSDPLTSANETTPLLSEERTGASKEPSKWPSTDKDIRSRSPGIFAVARNFISKKFSGLFNNKPDTKNYKLLQKAPVTEDESFELVPTNEHRLIEYYENLKLLPSTKDGLVTGVTKDAKIQAHLKSENVILSKPTLTGNKLRDQILRDAKGECIDIRLKKNNGTTETISHHELSGFAGSIDDQSAKLTDRLYDQLDAFLTSEGVKDASRRHHLRDLILNNSHQGVFSTHILMGSYVADTCIENLNRQPNKNTGPIRLYKSDEMMNIGVSYQEQNAAYTIKPDDHHRLVHTELQIDKDKQNLILKTVYNCPLILLKTSNGSVISGSQKRISIEAHSKLGLLLDKENKLELITAVEVIDNAKGSTQPDSEPVVLFGDSCQLCQDNIPGF